MRGVFTAMQTQNKPANGNSSDAKSAFAAYWERHKERAAKKKEKEKNKPLAQKIMSWVLTLLAAVVIAVCLSLFALSTILSWSLYGTRCCEYIFGHKSVKVYQILFICFIIIGATMSLADAWNLADALNGFMAIPNLIALLALSGVTVQLTKEHLSKSAK